MFWKRRGLATGWWCYRGIKRAEGCLLNTGREGQSSGRGKETVVCTEGVVGVAKETWMGQGGNEAQAQATEINSGGAAGE